MKEEEALVRTVRVICGSWNSKGVSAINLTAKHAKIANKKGSVRCKSNREMRENREQRMECPQEDRKFSRGVAKAFERAKKS